MFYGWVIVVVSTVGVVMSIPGQTMGVSVFTDSLLEATGLSRLSVSNAYLAGTLLSGLTLPWGGTLLDRWGARATGVLASIGLALTLVYLSSVDRLMPAQPVFRIGGLVLGFYALRFSGQGMLTMVSRTMLGRWFRTRRGLAAGVSGVFVSFGFGAAPLLFDAWIADAGWRGAWREMAVVVAVGMGAVAYLFYRNDPEACGLEMDGGGTKDEGPSEPEPEVTRGEAIRTLAFWAVTGALAFQALIVTGITFHVVDLGAAAGLLRDEAVAVFLPMSVVSTFVGLTGGILADRVPVRLLLLVMMGAQALGIVAATDLDGLFWLAVAGLGVSGGLFAPISTVAFPRFFGRTHLGAIAGVEMMCLVIASSLGPSLLAFSQTALGSYNPALFGCLALPAVAAILALGFRNPASR
ncbi:MAG: MFS transporter [Myxococcota bacterium]